MIATQWESEKLIEGHESPADRAINSRGNSRVKIPLRVTLVATNIHCEKTESNTCGGISGR